jgi:hypothetical protein
MDFNPLWNISCAGVYQICVGGIRDRGRAEKRVCCASKILVGRKFAGLFGRGLQMAEEDLLVAKSFVVNWQQARELWTLVANISSKSSPLPNSTSFLDRTSTSRLVKFHSHNHGELDTSGLYTSQQAGESKVKSESLERHKCRSETSAQRSCFESAAATFRPQVCLDMYFRRI